MSVSTPRSLTEQAMGHKREAYVERVCKNPPVLAPMWDREAERLLTLPGAPDLGVGGEVVRMHSTPAGHAQDVLKHEMKRANIRDTLAEGATRIAEEASVRRTDLLMRPSFDAVALAVDAADSIGAANSLEKMLAHQMAIAHEASMRLMDRALSYEAGGRAMREGDTVEACRLANSAARLMSVFQDGLLTLQKIRTGGNQTVTVQHVNVESGAQAVIGNVQTGGRRRRGNSGKTG
jgi:hypothetical protein